MFCTKCGTQISDDSKFCCKCGATVKAAEQKDSIEGSNYTGVEPTPTAPAPQPQAQPQNQASTAANDGVYGILGFALAFSFPLLGLIFSIIGINKKKCSGFATAGLILSIIFIVLSIIFFIAAETSSFKYSYYFRLL